jgi:carbon storage regulator
MLVLSRQRDESIMIGDDVEITIVDVRGDKVRLGITAPKSIPVHRREIYDAIQREKAQKADGQAPAAPGNGEPPVDKTEDPTRRKSAKPEKTTLENE